MFLNNNNRTHYYYVVRYRGDYSGGFIVVDWDVLVRCSPYAFLGVTYGPVCVWRVTGACTGDAMASL